MSDSDIVITRGKKRLHQGDEENPNTETENQSENQSRNWKNILIQNQTP